MPEEIFTTPVVDKYLQSHQLVTQFSKAILKFKSKNLSNLDFKKREPKSLDIWSFRITKKYRAFALREGNILKIFKIDDHQ